MAINNSGYSPDWLQDEKQLFRKALNGLDKNVRVNLSILCVNSFDGINIFAGGSFCEPAGSLRSALYISRDGGKTWIDSNVWLFGSDVWYIHFFDNKHIWFITCWSQEGVQAPYDICRTVDGGYTWSRANVSLPLHMMTSLCWIIDFSFTDPHHGHIVFKSAFGDIQKYSTKDGGITWQLQESSKITSDEMLTDDFSLFKDLKYKADMDWEKGAIYIKKFDIEHHKWNVIGTLPYYYYITNFN